MLAVGQDVPGSPPAVARQAVAEMLGIEPTAVRVISSEPRDFPDGSLGCPQPGMAYAQVITPGFEVLVEADARRYDVRVAGTRGRICHRRKAGADRRAGDGPPPRELAETARLDLALRLGIAPAAVTVTGLRQLGPGDTLPGCGIVCAPGTPEAACGVAVQLRAAEQEFGYRADRDGVQPCPDFAAR
ncbi:MAG: hypothetical protein ABI567_10180 [Gammaproteobacteria bacterium]